MSDKTHIEWTDATWNPVTGCSVVSPGCTNCYAMKLAGTRLRHHPSRKGLTQDTKAGPVWNGEVRFNEEWLTQPLRWRKPRMIFVCAHGDLFHESVPDEWIDMVFAVMALCPQHTFQVLTKRADRMKQYILGNPGIRIRSAMQAVHRSARIDMDWPLPNVWLGVSAEDQQRADERIPDLLATPAAIRFVSAEPLLGPINMADAMSTDAALKVLFEAQDAGRLDGHGSIHWVICGGESGTVARPMHPDWARLLRDECAAAGVPFFFKQWGSWRPAHPGDTFAAGKWVHVNGDTFGPVEGEAFHPAPLSAHVVRSGKKAAGALLDGIEQKQFPTPA